MISRLVSRVCFCLLSTLVGQAAFACSVCFVAKKENLAAFFATGVLISLLPFILVGAIGVWLYRQAKVQREFLRQTEMSQEELLRERPRPENLASRGCAARSRADKTALSVTLR